jgi:glucose/arabinose dehydrogenase
MEEGIPARRVRQRTAAASALALALIGAIAVLAAGGGQAAHARGSVVLNKIGDFKAPVYVDDAPGAPNLLFVVEQRGTIAVMRAGIKKPRPFLDIRDRVRHSGEQGLLSMAFDPNYENNRRFYVYFTTNGGDNQIDEFKRSADRATRARPASRRKVLRIDHPTASNHNGGQLQFGPDGYLYAAPGDGGSTPNKAQSPSTLLGKLLRIDPHPGGGDPYASPDDNPFVGEAGRDEIYALGLRNPFRFSFDFDNDAVVIGDVGAGSREELDYLPLAAANGANFGWPVCEGTQCSDDPPPNYAPPIHDYSHGSGRCVITAGYVVRDEDWPGGGIQGFVTYGDFCDGQIHAIDPASPGENVPLGLEVDRLSSFGEGANGDLYAVSLNGPVYSLDGP